MFVYVCVYICVFTYTMCVYIHSVCMYMCVYIYKMCAYVCVCVCVIADFHSPSLVNVYSLLRNRFAHLISPHVQVTGLLPGPAGWRVSRGGLSPLFPFLLTTGAASEVPGQSARGLNAFLQLHLDHLALSCHS